MRALVVGHGRMGQFHAKVLRDLGYMVTTVDPRPEASAMRLTVPIGVYYQAAVVAVPIRHLAGVAVDTERICERLLIEKPGAASVEEMRALREFIGVSRPAVGYTERFNPIVRAIVAGSTAEQRKQSIARIYRWSVRPSPDIWLDLASHDIDLATWLGFAETDYSTKAGAAEMIRRIDVEGPAFGNRSFNLLGHQQSPLHAQWHTFMTTRSGMCSLQEAEHVLERVKELREKAAAALLGEAA